jgi:CheY-like chemotaxis protein
MKSVDIGATILLVDDEPLILITIADQLEELGYQVSTAASGDEAHALIRAGTSFDLLLTDIRMPGAMDGVALVRYVKEARPGTKTMMMSGWAGSPNLSDRSADRFLQKPFTTARLEAEVRQLLAA